MTSSLAAVVAMHAPDGFLDTRVAVVTALLSAAVIGGALRATSRELGDRQTPLAGLAAAFVFAAQMVNFPVASGTSGHLLGGALAAILLGPRIGAVVVSVVVIVQALLFADGGVTALGYNVLNMAIVPAFGGWAAFRAFRRVLPADATGVVIATGLASAASVVMSAMAFSLEWLFGASAPVPFDTVFAAMVGVHIAIGVGEGVLSALVVSAVLASRPDLVVGATDLDPDALTTRRRVGVRAFLLGGLLVSLFVAAVVSQFAVDSPDGLERVADDEGFAAAAGEHAVGESVFADYATRGIDNEAVSLAVAGIAGVGLTLVVGWGIVSAGRRRTVR
jgi:cobalt/nickel transport system permease protein